MSVSTMSTLQAAQAGDPAAFEKLVGGHRRQLQAHCYRMVGSLHDAEDLVQEALLRAWRGLAGFQGRSSINTWLYRITTNTVLDALDKRPARTLPVAHGPSSTDARDAPAPTREVLWLEPCPDELFSDPAPGPDARCSARESVALAFLQVLQQLPPKQRAVLLLREVLGFSAQETAEVLEMTVAASNSALQRARETMDAAPRTPEVTVNAAQRTLLGRYLRAWEESDVAQLVAVLKDDARLSMPPMLSWFEGRDLIGASIGHMVLTPGSRGQFRMVETHANGQPAFGVYQRRPEDGRFHALGIQVLTLHGNTVSEVVAFLEPDLLPRFGLPAVLPAA